MHKVRGSLPGRNKSFFPIFTKILGFPLYFASSTSSICMLILDYPLRVNQKKIESSYSKFSMLLPNVQSPRLSRLVCGWGCMADFFVRPPNLTIGNFEAIWPKDLKFLAFKDLNYLKKYVKYQKTSSNLRVAFALSK